MHSHRPSNRFLSAIRRAFGNRKPAASCQPSARLCNLPVEILLQMMDNLSEANVMCLALTCRCFWRLFAKLPLSRDAMKEFLSLLEVEYPGQIPCHVCCAFHPRDFLETADLPIDADAFMRLGTGETHDRYVQSLIHFRHYYEFQDTICETGDRTKASRAARRRGLFLTESTKRYNCEALCGAVEIGGTTPLFYAVARLALRYERLGPSYGIAENRLSVTTKLARLSLAMRSNVSPVLPDLKKIVCLSRMINSRLFLRIENEFKMDIRLIQQPEHLLSVAFVSCPHTEFDPTTGAQVYYQSFLRHLQNDLKSHVASVSCSSCSRPHRCGYCMSEFSFSMDSSFSDIKQSISCRLTVWKDLGSLRSSDDPLWQAHCSNQRGRDRLDWRRTSPGPRSLANIFENRGISSVNRRPEDESVYLT